MRKRTITSSASALLLLTASLVSAKHGAHEHLEALHKRHHVHRHLDPRSTAENGEQGVEIRSTPETTTQATVEKRGGQCAFPTDAGLVAVTPGEANAGWAMSPDQPCTPGNYCPYACPPGEVMMQWDPTATAYTYPKSMNGGLYCDEDGNISKPFPSKPYCQSTASNIGVQNNAGSVVSFCQTVLPGNEAMLIPTAVTDYTALAVPDTSYWCGTAAHYYINPPGTDTDTACVWGTKNNPWGNWSPYVAGANVDTSGDTFIKLGWNPIYLEPATPFRNNMPTWGVKIDCPNGGCNGLPCAIDPSQNSVNQMVGSSSDGAGGGAFCVVTVDKGSTANFVVFNTGGDESDNNSGSSASSTTTWNNGGHGGQFFQSTSAAASSAPSSSSSSSTTTTAAWTSSASSSSSSSLTSSSVSLWTSVSASSTYKPTHSPYYSIFNNHTTYVPTESGPQISSSEATATPSGPSSAVQPSILPATGAASSIAISMAGLLSGLAFYALAAL
ncbi:hypothetical protein LTR99_000035 [Exophiala xenobiotica]|uniref:Uncharacterized protein n=1 Tax=Vermiconidia calcicola TaxID=1690605 RepID=A0AAV9PV74_9PEZI|nr:hypothetical protein LTR99_000035 [Exophiala xenobiotica]KAK5439071.1 hypothetical protein LTR34_000035 [Exophiala xenobiotica]KAK5530155.1 hypothetical protein LTR25_009401 [Vermiconidia calcicola]KAK5547475.1 hypothetical protein LTR23_002697 [Chaetothyriales sp. CCFEE 6169]